MTDSTSDRTEGYHVFIEPTGPLAIELKEVINLLSEEYGGPVFPPHVTLLARITNLPEEEMVESCTVAARALEPFMLTLAEPGMEDEYFRALYLTVQGGELLGLAHAQLNEAFFMEDDAPYLPHLSLLYGTQSIERKRAALAALPNLSGKTFLVDRFSLYQTEGSVAEWRKIQEFKFAA